MKSESGISYDNAAVASCPKHLLQFAVDQRYDDYTSVDHAVWRFIMRQNIFFLKEYAHKVYFQGLLNTGISFDRIPRIQEMNDILAKIGWGAVAVDGFIPPAAFMEFQAYKVLVIACDMRQIHHIEYTPAPGTRRSLSIANTRNICSALEKSARKRCRRKKISSCIKLSGTYRS
jgi:phenylalanine-4-hydroxylase